MIPVVIGVSFVLVAAGFLYLIALINTEARAERDQLATYYIELLLQAERQMAEEREMMIAERNSLLERIQRPEFVPPAPSIVPDIVNDEINDDLHLVGTVVDGNPPPDEAA